MVKGPVTGFLALAACFTPLLGCSPELDDHPEVTFSQVSQEIQGGEIDRANPAVVGVVMTSGYSYGTCSGTLIAPNLVLTAQHCVAEINSQYIYCGRSAFGATRAPRGVFITTNTYLTNDERNYHGVKEIFTGDKDDVCGNDIALLVLEDNVPADEAEPLVPRIDQPAIRGEQYTAIGYGHIGNGTGSGVRRILEDRWITCEGLNCPNYYQVKAREFLGSSGTCQGDSGGPAIDDEGRVLGALSRGAGECESSTYSAVAGWSDYIREIAIDAADQGGYEVPFWATLGVSEIPDDDLDLDGISIDEDNCPEIANSGQEDVDGDGLGDLCDDQDDTNSDGDDLLDIEDNCPFETNADQADEDGDDIGNACDPDFKEPTIIIKNPESGDGDIIVVRNNDGSKGGCQNSTVSSSPTWYGAFVLAFGMFFRRRRRD